MVTLRIQEQAEAKGITLTELGQLCGLSAEAMQKYATESIEITEETAADLRKVSAKLNVPVLELLKPVAKMAAIKLKIIEKAQKKNITLEQLSEQSGVHPGVIAFYSTQPISQEKLAEPPHRAHLSKISEILEVSSEDLKVATDMPTTMLRLEELEKEKGISLKDLSSLIGVNEELINLIVTQPIDPSLFINRTTERSDPACLVRCAVWLLTNQPPCPYKC